MGPEHDKAKKPSNTREESAALTPLPSQTQRIHFIFTPHKSDENAAFAAEALSQILRPELKGRVTVVFWHELAAPVNFPHGKQDLIDCYKYHQRKGLVMMPRVNWEPEFDRDTLSKNAAVGLHALHRYMANNTDKLYIDSLRENLSNVRLGSDDQKPWLKFMESLIQYEKDGWTVEHRIESAPWQAAFHNIWDRHCHKITASELMAGNFDGAIHCQARLDYHFHSSAKLRDDVFSQQMAGDFNPKSATVNICVRGAGHAPLIEQRLNSTGTPYQSVKWPEPMMFEKLMELQDWPAVLKRRDYSPRITQELNNRIIIEVGKVLLTEENGFTEKDGDNLWAAVSGISSPEFASAYREFIQERARTLKELVIGTFLWLSERDEVRSHPRWRDVSRSLQQSGNFLAID